MISQNAIDTLRKVEIGARGLFIDGAQTDGLNGETLPVTSPIDGRQFASIADGNAADVDHAVASARKTFEKGSWSRAAPAFRKKVLTKLAELIEKHVDELAVLGVRDNGTEIGMAYKAEPLSAAGTIRYYAEAIDKVYGEIAPTPDNVLGLIHKEPLGVVGVIVPWNFPLMIGAWKIAPALAAGNCVVVKPPEIASLTLLRLAELAAEAGLPGGVLNVVTGRGAVAGEALGLHMDVDAIAFTGSGPVGRRLLEYAARSNLKRVFLELGGKSPNIVFADAPDLKQAATVSANGIFRNSGQVCVAGSRLLVQSSVYDRFMDELLKATTRLKVGDPLDLLSDIGAVSSAEQLDKNLGFVARAAEEGARLVTGGERILVETGGSYMAPTIFENVTHDMQLAREEVFGPVLGVMRFDTEEEAVSLANSTAYGLASAVWTANLSTAHRMVRAIRAGVVHVNTYGGADITVPLGGVKQSGFGRDKSLHALDKYTDLKTAWIAL
ncbi:aldehyde dehydrogenase [Mesorhizobium amorphae]|uniref:Aldehyde dehydrogenase n=1 Tax=Mesorhizobium amorphae CCNWGS0123 TaxID=1082933 RepID=G6YE91_9HYPH|nr:aldehyde dehydrogenase [Mesorhizobium amorphae]ANT50199.1 aldehyde dehydrogenase [Mesorhizobium amorphae CCNWGS0123]EHH10032.1 aldehyde dehydrogenase [Mesorhizobium amorphae CCNWGS0123]GLR39605.1 aldehyde dehydrogenase [Mesorhizobium amorphae]